MKNYLDLRATNHQLNVEIELETIGRPKFNCGISNKLIEYHGNSDTINLSYKLDLLESFSVIIELIDKVYTTEYETAIIIKRLCIDNINLIPKYDYLAVYDNDHDNNTPTSYLGFNGKWTLTFSRPFYQWLHQVTGQGWLLN
jgi:hypothetical protein